MASHFAGKVLKSGVHIQHGMGGPKFWHFDFKMSRLVWPYSHGAYFGHLLFLAGIAVLIIPRFSVFDAELGFFPSLSEMIDVWRAWFDETVADAVVASGTDSSPFNQAFEENPNAAFTQSSDVEKQYYSLALLFVNFLVVCFAVHNAYLFQDSFPAFRTVKRRYIEKRDALENAKDLARSALFDEERKRGDIHGRSFDILEQYRLSKESLEALERESRTYKMDRDAVDVVQLVNEALTLYRKELAHRIHQNVGSSGFDRIKVVNMTTKTKKPISQATDPVGTTMETVLNLIQNYMALRSAEAEFFRWKASILSGHDESTDAELLKQPNGSTHETAPDHTGIQTSEDKDPS